MTSKHIFGSRGFLLDTNVLSETGKRRPHAGVMRFLQATPSASQFLSVLTLGELRIGVARLEKKNPTASALLSAWVDTVEAQFSERILLVDLHAAERWASFSAFQSRPPIDTLLAATAYAHGLTMVTRNPRDFDGLPIALLNPWED